MASPLFRVPAIGDEKPLSPEEKAELEVWRDKRKAEKAALEVKVREWTNELSKMPEWREMKEWRRAYKEARKYADSDFPDGTLADDAYHIAADVWDEMENYRKTKYLPALKAHPLGPEYIAARKRLRELKWC
jgi:hypothetical protein